MDVIGRDDLPTETKASATKLTNGIETQSEDNATVAAGAGRKKTKRKSKAKNSHREDAESELKTEAPSARATMATTMEKLNITSVTSPKVAPSTVEMESKERTNEESVNSNSSACGNSSRNRSSHMNGLPENDALDDTAIDGISEKLEQCVQICHNGLANGMLKQGDEFTEKMWSGLMDRTISTSATDTTEKVASKKKHRNSQAKKAQTTKTNCTVNGDVQHDDDEVDEQERKSLEPIPDRETSSAPLDPASLKNKIEVSESTQSSVKKFSQFLQSTELCTCAGKDQNRSDASSVPIAPESIVSLPSATNELVESAVAMTVPSIDNRAPVQITYQVYESERQMPAIMSLIQKDLSEPYSIYTYRYFIHNWPKLCFLALHGDICVGAIVCKLDIHRQDTRRGYIAMLAVDKEYRKLKIGTTLVQKAIQVMVEDNADEVVLETEITNQPALRLYENLGFVRDKRLFHYYLNGVDALRLKLWFR